MLAGKRPEISAKHPLLYVGAQNELFFHNLHRLVYGTNSVLWEVPKGAHAILGGDLTAHPSTPQHTLAHPSTPTPKMIKYANKMQIQANPDAPRQKQVFLRLFIRFKTITIKSKKASKKLPIFWK